MTERGPAWLIGRFVFYTIAGVCLGILASFVVIPLLYLVLSFFV